LARRVEEEYIIYYLILLKRILRSKAAIKLMHAKSKKDSLIGKSFRHNIRSNLSSVLKHGVTSDLHLCSFHPRSFLITLINFSTAKCWRQASSEVANFGAKNANEADRQRRKLVAAKYSATFPILVAASKRDFHPSLTVTERIDGK